MASIINALKYIPASLGIKALEKVNPKFKNYFSQAASYGIDATRALNYLSERFDNSSNSSFKSQLDQGEAQGSLRPDEQVSKQMIGTSELPGKALRGAAGLALGGTLSGAGEAETAPSQSKGNVIEQVSPKLHQFLTSHIQQGRHPHEAGAIAQSQGKFNSDISKLQKATGKKFSELLSEVYGAGEQTGQAQVKEQNSAGKQQFLAGLQQLQQSLQGLGKR